MHSANDGQDYTSFTLPPSTIDLLEKNSHVWIFGFGSLIHTPGFDHDQRIEGYIKNWKRVWWQGSTDHRGTVEHPGRTVTLTADPSAFTFGAAYRLSGDIETQKKTLLYLEWREKQYDLRAHVDVYASPDDTEPILHNALCYIATKSVNNPNYIGPSSLDSIAHQIARSLGPSGHNYEYLFKLADAMRHVPHADDELFVLEKKVRDRLLVLQSSSVDSSNNGKDDDDDVS